MTLGMTLSSTVCMKLTNLVTRCHVVLTKDSSMEVMHLGQSVYDSEHAATATLWNPVVKEHSPLVLEPQCLLDHRIITPRF